MTLIKEEKEINKINLIKHYNELYKNSVIKIKNGEYQIDELLMYPNNDKRYGLTLIIRPDCNTKNNIMNFLLDMKKIEPNQYYYSYSNIHITVISIISCYNEFNILDININDYIDIIKKSIKGEKEFIINFKGITASPSCIMVRGYPENETLNNIRNKLRYNFKNSNLQQSLDKRYQIQTAHTTVIRFKEKIDNKDCFLNVLNNFESINFGKFNIKSLELVYNDWYHKKSEKIHEFILN